MSNKKALLDLINLTYECLGRIPTSSDFSASIEKKILKEFYSLDEALNKSKVYDEEKFKQELIDKIKRYCEETGKFPNQKKLKNPSVGVYIRVFGSWENVLKSCNIKKGSVAENSRDNLISKLKGFYDVNGRAPFTREMSNPSAKVYRKVFGNWENALKAAGLPFDSIASTAIRGVRYQNKDDLIRKIQDMYKESGKIPLARELRGPRSEVYRRLFGSWENFLREAGLSKGKLNVDDEEKTEDLDAIKTTADENLVDVYEDADISEPYFKDEDLMGLSNIVIDDGISESSIDVSESEAVDKKEMIDAIVLNLDKYGASFKINNLPFSVSMYESEFGSWDAAYEEAVIEYITDYVM